MNEILANKKNLISLIVILFLLIALPVGIYLARTQQIFKPKAQQTSGSRINFVDGQGNLLPDPVTAATPNVNLLISYALTASINSQSINPQSSPSATIQSTPVYKADNHVKVRSLGSRVSVSSTNVSTQSVSTCGNSGGNAYCNDPDIGGDPDNPNLYSCNYNCPDYYGDGCYDTGNTPQACGTGNPTGICNPYDGNGDAEYNDFRGCAACNVEKWACAYAPNPILPFTVSPSDPNAQCGPAQHPELCGGPQPTPDTEDTCPVHATRQSDGYCWCESGYHPVNGNSCEPDNGGGGSCVHANPSIIDVLPANINSLHAGDSFSFSATIGNNNSNCDPEDFEISLTQDGNEISTMTLSMGSGQHFTAPLITLETSPNTPPGTYHVIHKISSVNQPQRFAQFDIPYTIVGQACTEASATMCWRNNGNSCHDSAEADSDCSAYWGSGSVCQHSPSEINFSENDHNDGCSAPPYPTRIRIREGGQERIQGFAGLSQIYSWTFTNPNQAGNKTFEVTFGDNASMWENRKVTGSINFQPASTGGADLVVTNATIVNPNPAANTPVIINATVNNIGSALAVDSTGKVKVTEAIVPRDGGNAVTATINLTAGIAPNQPQPVSFTTNSGLPAGVYTAWITVDPDAAIADSNRSNNQSSPVEFTVGSGGGGTNTLSITVSTSTCGTDGKMPVNITWNAFTGANSYKIFRQTVGAGGFTELNLIDASSHNYTDAPAVGSYIYKVSAFASTNGSGVALVSAQTNQAIQVTACGGSGGSCTTTPVCSGQCIATAANTCSASGGIQSGCSYTTGAAGCTPAVAPDQACTPTCSAGNVCNAQSQCVPSGGTAKYKCSGNSCIQDDVNGTFSTSDCNNACSAPPVVVPTNFKIVTAAVNNTDDSAAKQACLPILSSQVAKAWGVNSGGFTSGGNTMTGDITLSSTAAGIKAICVQYLNGTNILADASHPDGIYVTYIKKVVSQPTTSCPSGLASYWNMNEASGNTVADIIGSNNGTVSTGTGVTVGKLGNARSFDGTNGLINTAQDLNPILGNTASVAFWVKTAQSGNDTFWVAPGVSGVESQDNNDIRYGWIDASGRIHMDAGNGATAMSTSPINNNTWHHIVLTRDSSSGQVQVYVDGIASGSAISETGAKTTPFTTIGRRLGSFGGSNGFFNGSLDEFGVWNKVLNATEVASLYNSGNGFSCPSPDNSVATVAVTNPNGGQTFKVGDTMHITWTANIANQPILVASPIETWIHLTADGAGGVYNNKCVIVTRDSAIKANTNLNNGQWSGQFDWVIPQTCTIGTETNTVPNGDYRIMIILRGPDGNLLNLRHGNDNRIMIDVSDNTFRITPASAASRACPVLGDASDPCDGRVTGIDFQRWVDEFTGRLTTKRANFNPEVDDRVTGLDFQIWLTEFLKGI